MGYEIEFITDARFKGGTKRKLQQMDKQLKRNLKNFGDCVSLRDRSGVRELTFPPDYKGQPTKQWRKKYVVEKRCSKPTWNEVMKEINKIQAPYYKRVRR